MDNPEDDYNESEPKDVVHEESVNFVENDHQIETDKLGQLRLRKSQEKTTPKQFSDAGQK